MNQYFNLLWILFCGVLAIINTAFWPLVSTLLDKITGNTTRGSDPPDHGMICAFCWLVSMVMIGVLIYAPFNNWYQ